MKRNLPARYVLSIIAACLLGAFSVPFIAGCASGVAPGGAYTSVTLYNLDQGEVTTYQGLDVFEKWELAIRGTPADTEAIKSHANFIRLNAPKWFASYSIARAAYVSVSSAANLSALQESLQAAQAALAIANQFSK